MAAFICPTCGSDTSRLIGPNEKEGFVKFKCPKCFERPDLRPTYLHQKMEGATSKNLTIAKAHIIDNRVISREDKNVVIDRRTGKETQY